MKIPGMLRYLQERGDSVRDVLFNQKEGPLWSRLRLAFCLRRNCRYHSCRSSLYQQKASPRPCAGSRAFCGSRSYRADCMRCENCRGRIAGNRANPVCDCGAWRAYAVSRLLPSQEKAAFDNRSFTRAACGVRICDGVRVRVDALSRRLLHVGAGMPGADTRDAADFSPILVHLHKIICPTWRPEFRNRGACPAGKKRSYPLCRPRRPFAGSWCRPRRTVRPPFSRHPRAGEIGNAAFL